MNIATLVKIIGSIAIPAGSSTIVGHFVSQSIQNATKIEKICGMIAGSAISGLVADKATRHFHHEIDDICDSIDEFKAKRKKRKVTVVDKETGTKEVIELE